MTKAQSDTLAQWLNPSAGQVTSANLSAFCQGVYQLMLTAGWPADSNPTTEADFSNIQPPTTPTSTARVVLADASGKSYRMFKLGNDLYMRMGFYYQGAANGNSEMAMIVMFGSAKTAADSVSFAGSTYSPDFATTSSSQYVTTPCHLRAAAQAADEYAMCAVRSDIVVNMQRTTGTAVNGQAFIAVERLKALDGTPHPSGAWVIWTVASSQNPWVIAAWTIASAGVFTTRQGGFGVIDTSLTNAHVVNDYYVGPVVIQLATYAPATCKNILVGYSADFPNENVVVASAPGVSNGSFIALAAAGAGAMNETSQLAAPTTRGLVRFE